MKLRYLLATFLFIGISCYGLMILLINVAERSTTPFAHKQIVRTVTAPPVTPVAPEPVTSPADTINSAPDTTTTLLPEETPASLTQTTSGIPENPSQWGEATRGIVHRVNIRNQENTKTLFLTINAYSVNQPSLIQELINHNIKTTFFMSGYYVRRNPETAKLLAANQLFEIENLGNRCRSLSVEGRSMYGIAGTTDVNDALKEVSEGAASIAAITGKQPKYFRSATGYTDDVAVAAVNATGTKIIGYQSVTDAGGMLSAEEIKNRILQAENGSILVISINPERPNIFTGLQSALNDIKTQKLPIKFEKLAAFESAFETIR